MNEPSRKLVFLVNGNSRSGEKNAEEAKTELIAAGFGIKAFQVTYTPLEFQRQLEFHLSRNEPLIAIGGGDGTQRMAAEKIAGTSSAMAVIPLGTGNAWASDLGIPSGASNAAKALGCASVAHIDLGVANGKGFVNVATVGLTALIEKNLPKGLKGIFGKLTYLPAVIRSLKELRPFELDVETENDSYKGMALLFVAAAGRTHAGGFQVTRAASNNDGKLSLYALDDTNRKGLAAFGLGLLFGRHTQLSEVWSCEATAVEVKTKPRMRIIVDGERTGDCPLTLAIKPGVLRVLIPEEHSNND